LVAASAYALYSIANGIEEAKRFMKVDPLKLIGTGLLLALISGLIAIPLGENFMTGFWMEEKVPVIGKLGTPLLFDVGVYVLVLGITAKIVFSLAEEEQ
jgi:multicomponent Na+:H+ antiporter subunit B